MELTPEQTHLANVLAKRRQEIAEGKNACTRNPLYLVYDTRYFVIENTSGFSPSASVFNNPEEYIRGNVDDFEDFIVVSPSDDDFEEEEVQRAHPYEEGEIRTYGEVLKKVYYDRFVTVCFTREAAEAFIQADRHNLSNPRIYVDYCHHKNTEMLGILGEK